MLVTPQLRDLNCINFAVNERPHMQVVVPFEFCPFYDLPNVDSLYR